MFGEGFDPKDGDLLAVDRAEDQNPVLDGHGPESGCVGIAAEVSGSVIGHAEGEKPEEFDPKDGDLTSVDRSGAEQNPVLDGHGPESGCLEFAAEVSGLLTDGDMVEVSSVNVSVSKLGDDEEDGTAIVDCSHGGERVEANGVAAARRELEQLEEHDNSGDDVDNSSSQISSSSSSEEGEEDEDSDGANVMGDSRRRENGGVLVGKIGMVEGELDELVVSDDNEDSIRGPIRSRHELEVLPPVPRIEVQLEAHHRTLPVGVISSIMGDRVIVESLTQHNPLNEGSILWITESRAPLGIVDEVFGPVKNPYYVVRYNFEKDLPSGISVGTAVSFVMEFADHILNEKELHKKGYDASGDNDEELMNEFEFSDDEKEAEYRRSLREAKRGVKEAQPRHKKPFASKRRTNSEGFGARKEKDPLNTRSPVLAEQTRPDFSGMLQAPRAATVNFGCNNSFPIGAWNSCMSSAAMVPGAGTSCMSGAAMVPVAGTSCMSGPAMVPGAGNSFASGAAVVPGAGNSFASGAAAVPGAGNSCMSGAAMVLANPVAPQIAQALQLATALGAVAPFSTHTGACAGDQFQQLLLQQLNSLGQHHHNVNTQEVFATNILQSQPMGVNSCQQHHQNQNISGFPAGMPYAQQLAAAAQVQARPEWIGGQPNQSLGPMGQANFTQAPFVSGNMQNLGQRPPTTQGGESFQMQFNTGSSSFHPGNAFRGGGRHSLPRRG